MISNRPDQQSQLTHEELEKLIQEEQLAQEELEKLIQKEKTVQSNLYDRDPQKSHTIKISHAIQEKVNQEFSRILRTLDELEFETALRNEPLLRQVNNQYHENMLRYILHSAGHHHRLLIPYLKESRPDELQANNGAPFSDAAASYDGDLRLLLQKSIELHVDFSIYARSILQSFIGKTFRDSGDLASLLHDYPQLKAGINQILEDGDGSTILSRVLTSSHVLTDLSVLLDNGAIPTPQDMSMLQKELGAHISEEEAYCKKLPPNEPTTQLRLENLERARNLLQRLEETYENSLKPAAETPRAVSPD